MELNTMSRDLGAAQCFRSRTLKFVRESLGFSVPEENGAPGPTESDPVITSFGIVGEAMVASYTLRKSRWQVLLVRQEGLTSIRAARASARGD